MTKIRLFPGLICVALFLAACAPAASPVAPSLPVAASPTLPASLGSSTPVMAASTESAAASPFPLATSRGPNLEATDPTTVNLAAGGLQLVEFFRFT